MCSEGLAENLFDVLICPLGLAVGLGIVSTRVAPFDVEKLAELTSDFGHQTRVSIGEQGTREAMETDNVSEELLRDLEGVVGCAGFDEVPHFGGAVGEGEDGVAALTGWHRDPVHADGLPAAVGKLDGLE